MLNPFIYSLRNKEVKGALGRLLSRAVSWIWWTADLRTKLILWPLRQILWISISWFFIAFKRQQYFIFFSCYLLFYDILSWHILIVCNVLLWWFLICVWCTLNSCLIFYSQSSYGFACIFVFLSSKTSPIIPFNFLFSVAAP
jgi:hypothetical protein